MTSVITLCFLLGIIFFELFMLVRHDFFKNALIERGVIQQKPEDRADYNCILGWENTLKKLHIKADVCFMGNSITYGADFQKDYSDKVIVNLGYSGDRLEEMIFRQRQISAVNPDKIFIMVGSNDLEKQYMNKERFRNCYYVLVDSIINNNPDSELYLQSLLPVNHAIKPDLYSTQKIVDANSIIKDIAKERSLVYIDLFSKYADEKLELPKEYTYDGVHLFPSSYNLWSLELRQYIEK